MCGALTCWLLGLAGGGIVAAETDYPVVTPGPAGMAATVRVDAGQLAAQPVPAGLFGKFCEHLGSNIYHGMEAQILLNCTFSRWRASAGDNHPDGGVWELTDRERVRQRLEGHGRWARWPDPAAVSQAYFQGAAWGWFPVGEGVRLSPDTGPAGDRAQRIERAAGGTDEGGLAQWTWLPLHRTRGYQFRLVGRAAAPTQAQLRLSAADGDATAATTIELGTTWQTLTGELALPATAPADSLYRLAVTVPAGANVVLDRLLLYPDDHVGGADPDVIRLLREARLPLLRWPGGNFVSGYHWRDGVGPVDQRPVVPNPAWDGLEFNTFGTDEFIAFCRAVGCEPMICVNTGTGTPEEAAAWVEYCNGPSDSEYGRLRAAHGHPAPFDVRLWEVGNETYGRWQVGWTTPTGNLDRYRRFRTAMLAADPNIELLGCGHGNAPLSEWNRVLIDGAGAELTGITDHILTGGRVDGTVNGAELTAAFLGQGTILTEPYRQLRELMVAAGSRQPTLAITELQLFAQFSGAAGERLSPGTMPRPDTLAEALYLATVIHAAARSDGFITRLTHSATVNHGGGLAKYRERVWPHPVHHAHVLGRPLAGGRPAAVEVTCPTYQTSRAFGSIPALADVPLVDLLAVRHDSGELILSLVNRQVTGDPLPCRVELAGVTTGPTATVSLLTGESWHLRNTFEEPERVAPRESVTAITDGRLDLLLPALSYTVVRIPPAG